MTGLCLLGWTADAAAVCSRLLSRSRARCLMVAWAPSSCWGGGLGDRLALRHGLPTKKTLLALVDHVTTRKLAIGGRSFCGAPKLPCATTNILWRTIWDAPQKTCGPHHQWLDGILPHHFCGAWTWMRHKNMCFCGASGNMRHRNMGGPRQKKLREPFLWRM